MTNDDGRVYSDDGHYWWDHQAQTWQPVAQPPAAPNQAPGVSETVTGPGVSGGAGPDQPPYDQPQYGQPPAGTAPKSRVPRWVKWVGGTVVVVFLLGAIFGESEDGGGSGPDVSDQSDTSAKELSEATAVPESQSAWLEAVGTAQEAAEDANEMQVVAARKERSTQMCDILGKKLEVTDWVGTVESVETTLGGDSGVLRLEVAEDVGVGTWNNGFSDVTDNTLIDPDSEVWDQVVDLEEGDQILFSGRFADEGSNCIRESSVMDVSGVQRPQFILQFTKVGPFTDQ